VGAGSADCDLVEALLGLLLSHGQTSIVRQDGEKCESWVVLGRFRVSPIPLKHSHGEWDVKLNAKSAERDAKEALESLDPL
jgi:hypothetical protein